MIFGRLNLARDPFLNTRPVERFRRTAWIVGALLLVLNVLLFLQSRSASTDLRLQLGVMREAIAGESGEVDELRRALIRLRPQDQASRILFLNQKILQRTFPWGELFDHIGEVLPRNVRLTTLVPQVESGRLDDDGEMTDYGAKVALSIDGVARDDQQHLRLLDAFFAHPAFEDPDLGFERRLDDGSVRFAVRVGYLPFAVAAADGAAAREDKP